MDAEEIQSRLDLIRQLVQELYREAEMQNLNADQIGELLEETEGKLREVCQLVEELYVGAIVLEPMPGKVILPADQFNALVAVVFEHRGPPGFHLNRDTIHD